METIPPTDRERERDPGMREGRGLAFSYDLSFAAVSVHATSIN
jgi:hypothetical protein